ncbi:MAG: DUF4115 domain-containing protein [Desulfovibrio sp.]|nr:DUF4115 domain-containing protein [Desulfovibrio sp.]
MTLEELGAALRAAREKRMLNIEDAANRLKISGRVLRAMEAGDESSLPPLAYTKGFLRAYAGYVGFSDEEIAEAVHSLTATANTKQAAEPQSTYNLPQGTAPLRVFRYLVLLLLVLLAAGCLFVAWRHGVFDRLQAVRQMAQPVPGEETTAADNVPPTVVPSAPPQSPAPSVPELPPDSPASPVSPPTTASSGQLVSPVQEVPSAPAQTETAAKPNPPTETSHKIIITALEACWVHSSADKTDTRQFSLRKGEIFALTFTTSLELKLGNAGGVRLRYDGEEIPPVGRAGQVRTISFPPSSNDAQ